MQHHTKIGWISTWLHAGVCFNQLLFVLPIFALRSKSINMPVNLEAYQQLKESLLSSSATLVAVSKTKPMEDIMELYAAGQRDFGENYVQELMAKAVALPKDIRWHFIGHLQSNKVKMIAPFVHLIHGVDSVKLLDTIEKEGAKLNRKINCLLQVHIAREETKFGFDVNDAIQMLKKYVDDGSMRFANLCGLMGMASFSDDQQLVRKEFESLRSLFDQIQPEAVASQKEFDILSMGMSGDYPLALLCGSNMIRVGSLLFGSRNAQ
jgi:pyridoxal phosphate enzyme (YggS family)